MENQSKVFAGTTPTPGADDRVGFKAIMAKASGHRKPHTDDASASARDVSAEKRRDGHMRKASLEKPAYTLRVKPDRRRVQLEIPVDADRRRSR